MNKIITLSLSLISFFLLLSLFISCTASESNEELPDIKISEIKERINSSSDIIKNFEASGSISFDSPERSGSGWFEVKIIKPDTVYIKIEGPFGISIAKALITRGDFIYYNAQENTAISGPSSELNIGAILKIKISFDQLINGLTYSFIFEKDDRDSLPPSKEEGKYVLERKSGLKVEKFFISKEFLINGYKLTNSGISEIELDYSKHSKETIGGKYIAFPRKISVRNKLKKQSLYLDYENIEFNKREINYNIKIPSSAKRLVWD